MTKYNLDHFYAYLRVKYYVNSIKLTKKKNCAQWVIRINEISLEAIAMCAHEKEIRLRFANLYK